MSFPTDWDVEKYCIPTEPPQHWLLRKQFIETHKSKFPEQELVCLTNVFYNGEFLGCRYNAEVSDRINELANQVDSIVAYRIERKHKLQRTFVRASDAVKKDSGKPNDNTSNSNGQNSKCPTRNNKMPSHQTVRAISNPGDKELLARAQSQTGWKGKLVLIESADGLVVKPIVICMNSANRVGLTIKFKVIDEACSDPLREYQMLIDDELVVKCKTEYEKRARDELCAEALLLFKDYCFTIVEKKKLQGDTVSKVGTVTEKESEQKHLPPDSIGIKIMKLMGWAGQGLGKDESGIQEPIKAYVNGNRFGLGLNVPTSELRKKMTEFLQTFINNMDTHSLVFSSEFTIKERKQIHAIAQRFNLKSKSYGRGKERQLVVQKKLKSWEIVEDLLAGGGTTNDYTLIKPKKL